MDNSVSSILEGVEETVKVRTALQLFKGNNIIFLAALSSLPKSWGEFVTKFTEHFLDKERSSVLPIARLLNFMATLNAILEDTTRSWKC